MKRLITLGLGSCLRIYLAISEPKSVVRRQSFSYGDWCKCFVFLLILLSSIPVNGTSSVFQLFSSFLVFLVRCSSRRRRQPVCDERRQRQLRKLRRHQSGRRRQRPRDDRRDAIRHKRVESSVPRRSRSRSDGGNVAQRVNAIWRRQNVRRDAVGQT